VFQLHGLVGRLDNGNFARMSNQSAGEKVPSNAMADPVRDVDRPASPAIAPRRLGSLVGKKDKNYTLQT
jgi:hypothetical protein